MILKTKELNDILGNIPACPGKMNVLFLFSMIETWTNGKITDQEFLDDIKAFLK